MFVPDREARVPAGNVESELFRSPGAVLVDIVARLQLDMEELRADSLCRPHRDGLVRQHLHQLLCPKVYRGLLVGNNTDKF